MSYSKFVIYSIVLLAVGGSIGYTMTPTKTVTVTKTVEKVVVKRDVVTRVIKDPSGTETTVIVDRSTENTNTEAGSRTETSRINKDWAVSGAYLTGLNGKKEIVGSVSRRVIGEVYVGAFGTSEGRAGVGFTFRF